MNAKFTLEQLRVASPCPASWDEMRGDDKARFCGTCRKHVYNFAAMTMEEGLALVRKTEGELCVRLSRRRDGTVLTSDCPVGWAARVRRLRRQCVYGVIAAALMLLSFLGLLRLRGDAVRADRPAPTLEQIESWIDALRVWAGLPSTKTTTVMGGCPAPMTGKLAPPGG
jgi:hypothetical protein